jgi:hypothetical protein
MPAETDRDRARYWRDRDWLTYALHELPTGLLAGPDGATASECHEMLAKLEEFSRLCARLGLDDHEEFIEGCRWHCEHYPHYLSRRRHFADYESYTLDRSGPPHVADPPRPPRWLARQRGRHGHELG